MEGECTSRDVKDDVGSSTIATFFCESESEAYISKKT